MTTASLMPATTGPVLSWASTGRILRHCVATSLVSSLGVLVVFMDWRPLVWQSFIVSLCYSVPIALIGSILAPAVVRRVGSPGTRLTLSLSATFLVAAAMGSLVGTGLIVAIGWWAPETFWRWYWIMFRVTAALAVAFGLASYLYDRLTHEVQETRVREAHAMKLASDARLASLESRVRPHFLFNTLNSISALIPHDPARAETMVGRFAALLRGSLDQSKHDLISLGRELDMVESFLAIEQDRFGPRLQFTIAADETARAALVPPFSVQCLVENALKHGIGREASGGTVAVSARSERGGARIEVCDSGPGFDLSDVRPSHGLENLTERLDALFGDAARLEVERRNGAMTVTLVIPSATS